MATVPVVPSSPLPGAIASIFTDGSASEVLHSVPVGDYRSEQLSPARPVVLHSDFKEYHGATRLTNNTSLLPSSGLSSGSLLSSSLAWQAPRDIISTQTPTTLKNVYFSRERLLTIIDSLLYRRVSFSIKSKAAPPWQSSGPRRTRGASQCSLLATRRQIPWR